MSLEFANVTDIAIPQGDVTKIAETATGRVLWEKKAYPDLSLSWMRASANIGFSNSTDEQLIRGAGKLYYYGAGGRGDKGDGVVVCIRHTTFTSALQTHRLVRISIKEGEAVNNKKQYGLYSTVWPSPLAITSRSNFDNSYYLVAVGDDSFKNCYGVSDYVINDNYEVKGFLLLDYPTDKKNCLCPYKNDSFSSASDVTNLATLPQGMPSGQKVCITYSNARNEFLITDGSKLYLTNALGGVKTYLVSSIRKTVWVNELNMYVGVTGSDKNIQYSQDGITWTSVELETSTNVIDIEWLSEKKQLCALGKKQIALSSDCKTWTVKDAPFTNAICCAYSSDVDALCVVNTAAGYATRDFNEWKSLPIINNDTVTFREVVHIGQGIFIGYAWDADKIYFFSVAHTINNYSGYDPYFDNLAIDPI